METYYKKSIQFIKALGILLSKQQYNKLAQSNFLLSSESLEYISGRKFRELNKEIIKKNP